MRLRFSIRDLLWLTLVVAMGVGWFVHQQRLYVRLTETELTTETMRQTLTDRAMKWRRRTGALESCLTHTHRMTVQWTASSVRITTPEPFVSTHTEPTGATDGTEPSIQDD